MLSRVCVSCKVTAYRWYKKCCGDDGLCTTLYILSMFVIIQGGITHANEIYVYICKDYVKWHSHEDTWVANSICVVKWESVFNEVFDDGRFIDIWYYSCKYIYTVIEVAGFAVVCCRKKNNVQQILLLLHVYLVQCYIFFAD